jgi:hypothetical protein
MTDEPRPVDEPQEPQTPEREPEPEPEVVTVRPPEPRRDVRPIPSFPPDEVAPTGRTVANVQRERRQIT